MPHFGCVQLWTPQHVAQWISGLHPLAKQHGEMLARNNVDGTELMSLTWNQLGSMNIIGMYDQEALLSAISVLRQVDVSNKRFLVHPLAERSICSAAEALEHIFYLKLNRGDLLRKQELYMSCLNCANLTRTILLHMDKYHITYEERPKLAHDLLCALYSITHAAQQLKVSLQASGIHVPDLPQELPVSVIRSNFATCLQASLKSLVDNTLFIKGSCDVKSRGCPTFERITLQPDGDTGWGFSFRETSSGIYIIKRILHNTPADKSGRIKSGDEVIEVNHQNIVGWKIKNVVELIRCRPAGLIMVVRHYPDTCPASPNVTTEQVPLTPIVSRGEPSSLLHPSLLHPSLLDPSSTRQHHVSGAQSEPATDTPKKPPRPLDSVLRDRCRSNNELDRHFKTVHNPKRLSQIYGDRNLGFLSFEDMIETEAANRGAVTPRGKRANPTPPAHHRRNNSNPLDKYNIVTNKDWLDKIKPRSEHKKGKYSVFEDKYGTAPRERSSTPADFLNSSMPDISTATDPPHTIDKYTEYEEMDTTVTRNMNCRSPLNLNRVTSSQNHVTSSPNANANLVNSSSDVIRNLAAYCSEKELDNASKVVSDDLESVGTIHSTISNCTSVGTMDSTLSTRSKTLPRRHKTPQEDVGEFRNYPLSKEQIYTTCVIGGVVHKIPVTIASSEEDSVVRNQNTVKNRKRANKRSSWSEKAATLPKNIRFTISDHIDENGTLKKKKNKKPSRSTSSILGDVNVSCKSLYPNACEGWLLKLGGSGLTPRNWRRRWFVLKGFCLYYFKTPQDGTALGVITLPSFNIATAHEIKKKHVFKAYHKNTRTYYFVAETEDEKQRWMDKMLLASILYDESDRESGYGTGASPVTTDNCSMTMEHGAISPCQSLQSIASTTVVCE